MTNIENYSSVMNWRKSLETRARRHNRPFPMQTWKMRVGLLNEFRKFCGLDPDRLLQLPIDSVMKHLDGFHAKIRKRGVSHNSSITYLAYLRSFFARNRIVFPKVEEYMLPIPVDSMVSKIDSNFSTFDYSDSNRTVINDLLFRFVTLLNTRNSVIAQCLLATGADIGDILSLDVSFVFHQRNSQRLLWDGARCKTGIKFRVFFSKSATQALRDYLGTRRTGPLFLSRDGDRITVGAIESAFRKAADQLGMVEFGTYNPFRPKRFRHLFRTACAIAGIDPGFIQSWMGHRTSISNSYLERPPNLHLQQYLRAEPYLDVVPSTPIDELVKSQVDAFEARLKEKEARLTEKEATIEAYMKKIDKITRELRRQGLWEE